MSYAVLVLAAMAAAAAAQQTAPPAEQQASDGLTQQDVQVLKEAVGALQQSFQPAAPGQQQSAQASPAPPQRSMADVADKVVDMGARAIAQAAGTIQKVAPEVWRIMIRQQYAKAAGLLVVPGGMFLLFVFAWFKLGEFRVKVRTKWDSISSDAAGSAVVLGYIVPLAGLLSFGLWFLNRLSDSVLFLFNPEYYAFRDLLVMILNKGQGL